MTQKELINRVASETGVTKADTKLMVSAIVKVISDELAGAGFIKLSDFGTFSVGTIAEREVYNPLAGGTVFYGETKRVKFKTSKALRDRLNS